MSRAALFVIVGVLWCVRSLASFTDPAFTDPESAWDWFAVVSLSAALVALALALPSFARLVGGRVPRGVSLAPAAGAVIGSVGNLLEDGGQLGWAGDWLYLPSVALLVLGLAALTLAVVAGGHGTARLLAAIPAATLVGIVLLERGGGVLVLAAWLAAASVALRAGAGLASRRRRAAEPDVEA